MKNRIWLSIACLAALIACSSDGGVQGITPSPSPAPPPPPPPPPPPVQSHDTTGVPLTDLGSLTYKGFAGGLYPGASAIVPTTHASAGIARANSVAPLDVNGSPSAAGKYVLLSVGMSNTSDEFCGVGKTTNCDATTFIAGGAADPAVNHTTLVIVNGAQGGEDASDWDSPTDTAYDVVRDQRLRAFNVTEKQVEVVWLKQADARPSISLPATAADAYHLETLLGNILRALRVHYPNLKEVFISSRTYGGYATSPLNPEPYAFESGFSVKWIVQAQIDQIQSGQVVDVRAGDLNYNTVVPWIAWGPYLWADGSTPRSDGLKWERADFNSDGTHPSASGEQKVATMLLNFFKSSPQTKCWFLKSGTCP